MRNSGSLVTIMPTQGCESLGSGRWEEEEEAVFTRESITNEDPLNAQQAQHRPKPRAGDFDFATVSHV